MDDQLLSEPEILELAGLASGLLKADRSVMVARSKEQATVVRQATDVMEYHVPAWFEINRIKRGRFAVDGPFAHYYATDDRLVLIERSDALGKLWQRAISYDGDELNFVSWSVFGARERTERAGVSGRRGDTGYSVSVDPLKRPRAELWSATDSPPTVHIWDSVTSVWTAYDLEYDSTNHLVAVRSAGTTIWLAKPSASRKSLYSAARAAAEILKQVRASPASRGVPVVYLLCFEGSNAAYLPPQLGIVYEEDLNYLSANPERFEDGISSLLVPTLQEDYDFPTATSYPVLELGGGRLDPLFEGWADDQVDQRMIEITEVLNRIRPAGMAPFLAVDMEDDGTKSVGALPQETQQRLKL